MGCDFCVHIWDKSKFDEDVLEANGCHTLGSKYFRWGDCRSLERAIEKKYDKDDYTILSETPTYNMGEVSFLKRAMFEDDSYLYGKDDYVGLFDGDPEPITEALIKKASKVDKDLGAFLEKYKEHCCFTICW